MVADKAKRHKIKLNFIKPKQDLVITADLKLLVKALYEVIDNAIIYSSANASVRIEATLHQEEIVLLVQDKGIGIPVEQQSLIFTKFFADKIYRSAVWALVWACLSANPLSAC